MTVSTTTSTAQFLPNGVNTNFPFAFRFFAATDLKVFWQKPDGTIQLLVLNSNYTVQGAGNNAGGSITTIGTPLPNGLLVVSRIMVATQLTSFRNQGEFFAEIHEDAFDKLVMLVQQTIDNQGRGITVPVADPLNINLELPGAVARSGKMAAFDNLGNVIISNLTLAQIEQQPALALESAQQAALSAQASSDSKDAASISALASGNSATLAMKWAENPEDVPVQPGLFSAHHWANKAAAVAATISGLYTRMTAVELRATNLEYSYISPNTAFTNGGSITLSHGLGVRPQRISWEAICTTADASYAVGTVLYLGEGLNWAITGTAFGFTVEATNSQIICNIAGGGIPVVNKSTRLTYALIPGSWMLRAKASKS